MTQKQGWIQEVGKQLYKRICQFLSLNNCHIIILELLFRNEIKIYIFTLQDTKIIVKYVFTLQDSKIRLYLRIFENQIIQNNFCKASVYNINKNYLQQKTYQKTYLKIYQKIQQSITKILMGTTQPIKASTKRRQTLQQSRIEGLYEMYNESIRVSSMIKEKSMYEDEQYELRNGKYVKRKKFLQNEREFLRELMECFEQRDDYAWASEISKLFAKHFEKGFEGKWYESKEFFYELLLENSGIEPYSEQLVARSHLVTAQKQKKLRQLKPFTKHKYMQQKSFQSYFLKQIHERKKSSGHQIMKSSQVIIQEQEDTIDRRKDQEIVEMAQVESMRMTGDQSVNYVNSSIIDAEEEKIFPQKSDRQKDKQLFDKQNDDEYFLPLITKRNKLKRNTRKPSHDSNQLFQPLIQMSQFESKANYSRYRLQTSSVILPSTVFYQRMNFTAKVQTDQLLKIYRQLSNTIQQTINSCNLISCPLKHFILYFQFKTSKKNINQLTHSSSLTTLTQSITNEQKTSRINKSIRDDQKISQFNKSIINNNQKISQTDDTSPQTPILQKRNLSSTSDKKYPNSYRNPSNTQQLYILLTQTSQRSQLIRKKRQYNTNYLLKEIRQFAQAYTEFLYKYLNFSKIQQTDLQNFVNLDTVYGIVLRNIWNIVTWIADRGYEWEEYVIKEIVAKDNTQILMNFTQKQAVTNPHIILQSYAKFANKQINKIRIQPSRFLKAYLALLKLKDQLFPQKYLKKIIIFYRQATKCCQGADDLMTLYQFLLKNCILNGFTQEMHIFRMKNIIDKLIPIESSSIDGAGEIVYAWTTWNIMLEMFMVKLNEHKQLASK